MSPLNTDTARVPVYLERYVAEAEQWRRDAFAARIRRDDARPPRAHPRDRQRSHGPRSCFTNPTTPKQS